MGDGGVCEDCDACLLDVDSDVWSRAVGVAVPVRGLASTKVQGRRFIDTDNFD